MDYKETLHMPKTTFEMRGNLAKKEPGYQQRWLDQHLFEQMLSAREGAENFVLHDGPPYANGDIHLGHALNKIIKDIINKSKFMQGYRVPYIPGWDTHGLPVETAVTNLGYDRKKIGIPEFRQICEDFAKEQIEKQKEGFISLGVIGDFDHPYITFKPEFEARQIEIFGQMAQKGLIYQGLKPVYWSPSSESALAEAEIEYKDIKSPTIYVTFDVKDGKGVLDKGDKLVIWTTTPWTIPGNRGISVHPRFDYALVKTEKGNLVVLAEMVEELMKIFEIEDYEIVKTIKGAEMEGILARHPLYPDIDSLVMVGEHVTNDSGTGLVHTAPGFGMDDFIIGQKYGLPVVVNVDGQGKMMEETGERLAGLTTDQANKEVTLWLDELGALLNLSFITHAYPHDWRTKKPIIFRATTQWFASIDKIRDELLDQIHSISWVPAWGEGRMHNMIADRDDWCISRQRVWGVPIPIIYGEDGTPLMEPEIFEHVAKIFREKGSNAWFDLDVMELLPEGYSSKHSPNGVFTKETDTMDVWFDSGSSHTGAMIERGFDYPVDLYFEGSDQYRGWFNSSLIVGTAIYGKAPYKQVLSHGFVMDEKGRKMSKSQWNSVAPGQITKKYGADILRLWAASVDYQADCSMGNTILKQISDSYRKVRNTFRFMIANLDNNTFGQKDLVPLEELDSLNLYILMQLEEISRQVIEAYNEYRYSDIVTMLGNFMTNVLSAYYLDYTKDILYIEKLDDPYRRQVQTVLYLCTEVLAKLWAPILAHTMEEINDIMKFDENSIHLSSFKHLDLPQREHLIEEMDQLMALRKDVLKALEEARNEEKIGKSLEAALRLHLPENLIALLEKHVQSPKQWLIVSDVTVDKNPEDEISIEVEKAKGHVCPRCWNITESEGELCERCQAVLAE